MLNPKTAGYSSTNLLALSGNVESFKYSMIPRITKKLAIHIRRSDNHRTGNYQDVLDAMNTDKMTNVVMKWNVRLVPNENYSPLTTLPHYISPLPSDLLSNEEKKTSKGKPLNVHKVISSILVSAQCLVYGYLADVRIPQEIRSICFDYFIGFDLSLNGFDKLFKISYDDTSDILSPHVGSEQKYKNHQQIENALIQIGLRSLCPSTFSSKDSKDALDCYALINTYQEEHPFSKRFRVNFCDCSVTDLLRLLPNGTYHKEAILQQIESKFRVMKHRPPTTVFSRFLANDYGVHGHSILHSMVKTIHPLKVKFEIMDHEVFANIICDLLNSQKYENDGWKLLHAAFKHHQSDYMCVQELTAFIEGKAELLLTAVVKNVSILKDKNSIPEDIKKAKRRLELGVRTCYHIKVITSEKCDWIGHLTNFNEFYAHFKKSMQCEEFFDAIYRAEGQQKD